MISRRDRRVVVEYKTVPVQSFFSRSSPDIDGHPTAHDAPLGIVEDRPDPRFRNPRRLEEYESDVGSVSKFPRRTGLPQEQFRKPGALFVAHAKVGLERLHRTIDGCPMPNR